MRVHRSASSARRPSSRTASLVRLSALLALFLGVAGLAGCAAPPQATLEEQQAYDDAIADAADDPTETARKLELFLRAHRESPLAEPAASLRARIATDAGDDGTATFWLGWLVRNFPRGDYSDVARLDLARISYKRGDFETARDALEDLRVRELDAGQAHLAYRLRAEVALDAVERLHWLAVARLAATDGIDGGVREEALELIDAELASVVDELSPDDLKRASEILRGRVPAGRVALRRAEAYMEADDYDAAGDMLKRAERLELGETEQGFLETLRRRMGYASATGEGELLPPFAEVAELEIPSSEGAVGTLGVVLPLSGPYASYGEESLRGVLLAAGIFDPIQESAEEASSATDVDAIDENAVDEEGEREYEGERLRIVVRDSAGDADRIEGVIRELSDEQDVAAIVGPLRSKVSEVAARVAEEVEVPLVALTTRESVPRDRPNVFRIRTTPDDELRYLVNYAFEELGARRFAVLYPEDGYGRGMRDHFWRMVEERGGWLVAASPYDPTATDFGRSIRRLIGFELLTRSEQSALVERDAFVRRGRRLPMEYRPLVREIAENMIGPEAEPLPPIVDFDALFIPDGYSKAALVIPQLAFNDLTGVQLLGPGDWNDPKLIEIAQEHVSGAVISAPFDAASRFPFVATFVDRYRDSYGTEPDAYSANAYDAAQLVLIQLAKGRTDRDDVREGISRMRAYPGASGVLSMRPDGNASKRPFLLQVRGREMVPLD